MNAGQMVCFEENQQRLRLFKEKERIEALLQDAGSKEHSYADFLEGLLVAEVSAKTGKNIIMRTNLTWFPFVQGLDAFDFAYQPLIDKKQIGNISSCHFIDMARTL